MRRLQWLLVVAALMAVATAAVIITTVQEVRPAPVTSHVRVPQRPPAKAWNGPLQEMIATATRLRVRSGSTCHRRPERERTIFEVTDPLLLRELASWIVIEESSGGLPCSCCGDPTLELYDGDTLVAELDLHHAHRLRWKEWHSDGKLTPESAAFLVHWLDVRGASRPRQ